MRASLWAGTGAAVASVLGAVQPAEACKPGGDDILTVKETGTGSPPGPIGGATHSVKRGRGPESAGCGRQSATSCDGMGSIALYFAVSKDPDSAPEAVGYRLRVVGGTLPTSILLPAEPVRAYRGGGGSEGTLWLHWQDGKTDSQESIAFSVALTPVDQDGNEGPESAPIVISDDGGGGCGVGRGRAAGTTTGLLPAMALCLVTIRRRQSACSWRATNDPGLPAASNRSR